MIFDIYFLEGQDQCTQNPYFICSSPKIYFSRRSWLRKVISCKSSCCKQEYNLIQKESVIIPGWGKGIYGKTLGFIRETYSQLGRVWSVTSRLGARKGTPTLEEGGGGMEVGTLCSHPVQIHISLCMGCPLV
jgi:hypothetical protein